MCTSIAKTMGDFYFGRNMDLEYEFGQEVAVTPRDYPLPFRCAGTQVRHHAIIGMARVQEGYPLYADAANEHGLCMAGLNFPHSAHYDVENLSGAANVSPFELIPWVLAQCATVDQAAALLQHTHLTALPFSAEIGVSPLHWHVADSARSVVVEPMAEGLVIRENPIGVTTNEPSFDFHLTNLRQYLRLTPEEPVSAFPEAAGLLPFGWGFGALGLPGDTSSASRFVRAAYHAWYSAAGDTEESRVGQFFHLLNTVAMPRGSVRASGGRWEITLYSCCINASRGAYYVRTYDNSRIAAVYLGDPEGGGLRRYPLRRDEEIARVN